MQRDDAGHLAGRGEVRHGLDRSSAGLEHDVEPRRADEVGLCAKSSTTTSSPRPLAAPHAELSSATRAKYVRNGSSNPWCAPIFSDSSRRSRTCTLHMSCPVSCSNAQAAAAGRSARWRALCSRLSIVVRSPGATRSMPSVLNPAADRISIMSGREPDDLEEARVVDQRLLHVHQCGGDGIDARGHTGEVDDHPTRGRWQRTQHVVGEGFGRAGIHPSTEPDGDRCPSRPIVRTGQTVIHWSH
jgi:hypothetical protein